MIVIKIVMVMIIRIMMMVTVIIIIVTNDSGLVISHIFKHKIVYTIIVVTARSKTKIPSFVYDKAEFLIVNSSPSILGKNQLQFWFQQVRLKYC